MSDHENEISAEQLQLEEAPNVYSYNGTSRILIGVDKADLDALSYQLTGAVNWLVPANATLLAPPPFDPETQVAIFDPQAASWAVVAKPATPVDPEAPLPTFDDQQAAVIMSIDAEVDDIIARTIGNRATEYLLAETEAQAFKQAGYPEDDVPSCVEDDMLAFNRTAREAADAILTQAGAWRQAQQIMRRQRLLRKEEARNAATIDDLAGVINKWRGFTTFIKQQLGI